MAKLNFFCKRILLVIEKRMVNSQLTLYDKHVSRKKKINKFYKLYLMLILVKEICFFKDCKIMVFKVKVFFPNSFIF